MEDVGIFMATLPILRSNGYISWPFGTICGHWYTFPALACCTEKNLATLR
jgi:hypothetical protein